jgi:hypothetical protein
MCTNSSCFYGTCTNTGQCICNNGWQKDTVLFHNENCTIPTGTFLGIMIITITVYYGAILYMIFIRKNTRSVVKHAFDIAIIYMIAQSMVSVGIYIQDGNYEISSFFAACAASLAGFWAWVMLKLVILPLFVLGQMKEQISKIFFINCIFTSFAFAITLLTLAGTCRMDNSIYNGAVIGQLLTGLFFSLLFATSYVIEATLFLKEAKPVFENALANADQASVEKTKKALEKIEALRKQMFVLGANMMITLLPWVITQLVLGYAPFSWIFFAVANIGNGIQITQLTISLANKKLSNVSSSSSTNNNRQLSPGTTSPTTDGG